MGGGALTAALAVRARLMQFHREWESASPAIDIDRGWPKAYTVASSRPAIANYSNKIRMAQLTPQEFVAKWRNVSLRERASAQEHFIDLCRLLNHPTPAEDDPTGERFTFEAGAAKTGGGQGWADVWKRGFFAWEYKGKHADLDRAYGQLLQYRESLQNPPLLVVSDIERIIVHTNFTNTVKQVVTIALDDLLTPAGVQRLRDIFYSPEAYRSPQTTEQVTQEAAREFARLAEHLRRWGEEPEQTAHFLIRILFCLFAEDIQLLPKGLFTRMIDQGRRRPADFGRLLGQLFEAMTSGGYFGVDEIRNFDGGLFDDANVLELDREALDILHRVARLDWSNIEPSILGTLFTAALDPAKRAQLGAQYTSKEDILLIVEPVLMAPLRREWEAVKEKARALAARRDQAADRGPRTRLTNELRQLVMGFGQRLATVRVLDPACGSANFLYVSLRLLLDLWKEVALFAGEVGLSLPLPLPGESPSPEQLYGIEIDPYAHELAQATVWIGYLQWLHENGYGIPPEPILKPLDNIKQMDAILAYDAEGKPVEPEWPAADIVIGNPPFLGGNRIRQELGNSYVDSLFVLYDGRIPAFADLVCYWFERAREGIAQGQVKRAGLLATNSIRGGVNRRVLERIKDTGGIFMAWSNRPWVLDGAAVRVSMIAFDKGFESEITLDGVPTKAIYSDLTGDLNLSQAKTLVENLSICFIGTKKAGDFDISSELANVLLSLTGNPNGKPNSDVVFKWLNGETIVKRVPQRWIIYFGELSEGDASLYEKPFEYVREHVYPARQTNNEKRAREKWWQHRRPAIEMKTAVQRLQRYIATPRISKYRIFTWIPSGVLPDDGVYIFARQDDYFIGVLHSKPHELWALRTGTSLEDRPRYTPTTTFETFPFPWPPGKEPADDLGVQAIAQAAKELVEKRDAWLNPPGLSEAELKKRTLTNLYNQRPTWLDLAHKKLDAAVFAAYGWPADLSDEEILERLLALNLERAA